MPAPDTREVTTEDRPAWDDFVVSSHEGDPLQVWAWGEANEGSHERPHRIIAVDPHDGRLRGAVLVLARATGRGRSILYAPHGPLWDRDAPDSADVLAAVLEGMRRLGTKQRGIVLKLDPRANGADADGLRQALEHAGSGQLVGARHDLQAPTTRIVDLLDGGEQLMATWDADARRLSRRSEREGVVVDVDRTGASAPIGEFHALLEATAERGEFRVRSREFLERAAAAFAASTGWYTVLARHGGRAIAGMAVPRVGDRGYYLYGASLKDPELKHKYGAYAAMAGAMRELAADGVRTLDMWGVVEPDDPTADPRWEGFSAFKRTFGGRPLRHPGTFDLVLDPLWYRLRDARERLRERLGA